MQRMHGGRWDTAELNRLMADDGCKMWGWERRCSVLLFIGSGVGDVDMAIFDDDKLFVWAVEDFHITIIDLSEVQDLKNLQTNDIQCLWRSMHVLCSPAVSALAQLIHCDYIFRWSFLISVDTQVKGYVLIDLGMNEFPWFGRRVCEAFYHFLTLKSRSWIH